MARRRKELRLRARSVFCLTPCFFGHALLGDQLLDQHLVFVRVLDRLEHCVAEIAAVKNSKQEHRRHHDRGGVVRGILHPDHAHDQRQYGQQHEHVERRTVAGIQRQ